MIKKLQSIADWLIGPRLQVALKNTLRSLLHKPVERNRDLRTQHQGGGRCFVIGNGPSLKNMDLSLIANEVTIGANSFYKHPDAKKVGLNYLCIYDAHFMADNAQCVEWHKIIDAELTEAKFVFNATAEALVRKYGLYPGRDVYYVAHGANTDKPEDVNLDFALPLNVGATTGSSVAIPLAMSMGFKEIYLIGFDCNWLEDRGKSYHFYNKHDQFPEFDSTAKDSQHRDCCYEEELRTVLNEFSSHRLLRDKARLMGVRIVNATEGGLLDVYERKDYASLFAG